MYFRKIEKGSYRPSKKLMNHVANVIKGKPEFILLDNQKVVYDMVFAEAKRSQDTSQKTVMIIEGGPGTGKSVIAINLMADLLLAGYNAHYATGSKAFTTTLRNIIGTRGACQFKYFNSYMNVGLNEIDVIICDEAHRLRKTSNNRFTPASRRSNLAQIDEIIRAAKVSVFLLDDKQVVRPDEIGSVDYIYESALRNNCRVVKFEELDIQFRCNGSDAFVNWINNTLGIKRTANVLWDPDNESFDFRIFDTPEALEKAIREKAKEGYSARMTAGYCWEWSDPRNDGTLVEDVVIGNYRRPWNAKPDAGRLAKGIPEASLWAHDPNGINQIGCVYTAQGFEFDYVGVIMGEDLVYDFDAQTWIGDKSKSFDSVVKRSGNNFVDLIKNIYRVLFTRGMKGCYVYFINKVTEKFFKSRMLPQKTTAAKTVTGQNNVIILDNVEDSKKFKEYLPVYSLKAVATSFGNEEHVELSGWIKVDAPVKLNRDMFIAQVVGKSMEPTIKDGSYCIFRFERDGSRNGKIVLVESHLVSDPETMQSYTIKRYRSKKEYDATGTWYHKKIILSPDNLDFDDIVLENVPEGAFRVVAEFVCALEAENHE